MKEYQDLYPNECLLNEYRKGTIQSPNNFSVFLPRYSLTTTHQLLSFRLELNLSDTFMRPPLLVCHSLPLGASQRVTVDFEVSQTESFD